MADNEIILTAENIHKTYKTVEKKSLEVLKGISLEIKRNKITVIIGASGAGKSTLLHILSGLDRPDLGEVKIDSQNIFNLNDEKLSSFRNKHIGFVFQFHHLLPEFTAAENVALPLLIDNNSLKSSLKKAEEVLELVGLKDRIHHKPAELSGGEQQRIAVARALINDASVIFADEPTGNLDSVNSEMIHNLFVDLRDKFQKTFVIVTHNKDLVNLADEVFDMKDGRLKE